MLLAPFRAKCERLESEARAILAELPEDYQCSMGYDAVTTALDTFETVGLCASDLRREVYQAQEKRGGFDTWTYAERQMFLDWAEPLVKTLDDLNEAIRDLRRAEKLELESLRNAVPA